MNIPDGYSDIPSGKTVAVVTHLQMLQQRRPGPNAQRRRGRFARSISLTPIGTAPCSGG